MIAPGFGGINLEDIAAPRCFEIEARLRASLDIPVFHDDQHGTAIVVLAALTNALRVVGKKLRRRPHRRRRRGRGRLGDRHPAAGRRARRRRRVGPRGPACRPTTTTLPLGQGRAGRAHQPAQGTRRPARRPPRRRRVRRASARPNVLDPSGSRTWPTDAVVFALANPDPEVDPAEADKYAAVVASGRSRLPQPDQQRAGVPRRLPRPARRPRQGDHHRHAAPRRRRDRARGDRRGAQPELHHPERLQPGVPKAVAAAIRGQLAQGRIDGVPTDSRETSTPDRHRRRRTSDLWTYVGPGRAGREHRQPVRPHAAVRRPADAVRRPRGRGPGRARLPVRPVRQPGAGLGGRDRVVLRDVVRRDRSRCSPRSRSTATTRTRSARGCKRGEGRPPRRRTSSGTSPSSCVGRDGSVLARYGPKREPEPSSTADVEKALAAE